MTINLPDLDDRSYSDLVEEGLELLPRYAPEWTNHNPSDPGITLIELLAYFTEAIVYRTNRLTDNDRQTFLKLLEGDVPEQLKGIAVSNQETISERTLKIIAELQQPKRAIIPTDYEVLSIRASSEGKTKIGIARAHCVPRSDLTHGVSDRDLNRPGFISVVIIPHRDVPANEIQQCLVDVQSYLESRCLLTTRLRVVPPVYVRITFQVDLGLNEGENHADITAKIDSSIKRYFRHLPDEERGTKGWPFGRNVYISELIDHLESIEGVDFVNHPRVVGLQTHDTAEPVTTKTLGFQIGIRSTIGKDTVFGAKEAIEWHRIGLDALGQHSIVLLNSYELPRVDLKVGKLIA